MKIDKSILKNKKILIFIIILLIIIIGFYFFKNISKEEEFKVDTILLKSSIKEGESITNNVRIANIGYSKDFKIDAKNLEDLVFLDETRFKLKENEVKDLKVSFKGLKEPGIYVGTLVVKSNEVKEIPVILEIRSKEVLFATNLDVSPEFKGIKPGEKVPVGIRIFNLRDGKTNTIELSYLIKNFNSETIFSETENVVVGTETSVTKTVNIPKDVVLGDYVFGVIAKFDGSVSTSSYLFSIKKDNFKLGLSIDYFAVLILIFLFGIIALIAYMVHDRDKLFLELKKQHKEEINFCIKNVGEREKKELAKARNSPKKRKIKRNYKIIKKRIVKKVREKHRKQRIEFKRLKKQKKKSKMEQKLREWKRQGFDVNELLAKEGKVSKANINKWRKQGYKI